MRRLASSKPRVCRSVAPVKGEVRELLKHKFLDVDLPYELRVTEAALTEFIRRGAF